MLNFIRKLFHDPTAEWPRVVHDEMLGEIRLAGDADGWEGRFPWEGTAVRFSVGGEGAPDAALLAHVREIAANRATFERKCEMFLRTAAREYPVPGYAEEVLGLRLEGVNLFWPDRPDDGMLSFSGGENYRLWRCDYVAREPRGLGFDS